jgi:hypothetical protein
LLVVTFSTGGATVAFFGVKTACLVNVLNATKTGVCLRVSNQDPHSY